VSAVRIGVLGAARIAEQAIVGPAHATGSRLVTVAARPAPRGGVTFLVIGSDSTLLAAAATEQLGAARR
jgi:hypothetical protein